ncbi:glycosyltransferase family 4 protein [Gangjinia marincola]|uniref:Glycosyltransferase family 4 protein n=1 Tax=Gangjinia marincola TaxID=578463 RepID=A0ABN1MDG8_9FLAO
MQKVLIITYYWPPAGGPGVQRWLKFASYLPQFGITPIIYTPQNPSYPIVDDQLINEVPKGIEVIKEPIKEPYRKAALFSQKDAKTISSGIIPKQEKQSLLQKSLLFIRGNFFIPDARKAWVAPSVKFLSQYLVQHKIESIITTGPPHSLHLIGLQLKKHLNVNWIADFRDPWTAISYHSELKLLPQAKKRHLNLEKEVLQSAHHIITTSFSTQREFQQKTLQPVALITNGYEKEADPGVNLDSKFSLVHIGSLLSNRNPTVLWKVLRELIKDNPAFAEAFQLRMAGKVSQEVLNVIEEYQLNPYLKLDGYISHKEALTVQQSAQVLLLIEADTKATRAIIPGKLFEYIAAKRPILAIGPKVWDVQHIIDETQSGSVLDYQDYDVLKKSLLDYFKLYQQQKLISHSKSTLKYHRKSLTEALSKIIFQYVDQ